MSTDVTTPAEKRRAMYRTELFRQRIQHKVRDTLRKEEADRAFKEPESDWTLKDTLAKDLPPLRYTIDRLHPTGGNSLIAAQYKVGKTTLAMNLARSYADGDCFMGQFNVKPGDGRIAILNYELTEEQFLAYVKPLNIENPDNVAVLHLRGYRFDLRSPRAAEWAVNWLQERECVAMIVDPFGAAARLTNENDNSEARLWLMALDELKAEAGIDDLWMLAHTGRGMADEGAEHVRGASAVDDWADVRWSYTKQNGHRYLSADGRGVYVPEFQVGFERANSELYLAAVTGRAANRGEAALRGAVEAVSANPGIGKTKLRDAMSGDTKDREAGIREAVNLGYVRVEEGPKNAKFHHVTEAGEAFLATS